MGEHNGHWAGQPRIATMSKDDAEWFAALADTGEGMSSHKVVTGAHLTAACAELLGSTSTLTLLALGSPAPE